MDFDEQAVAEAEELLIEELRMPGFQGMFIKLLKPKTSINLQCKE